MIEKQLSVLLENKVGVLAEVCKTLAAHGINIKGMSISDTVDHAVLRLIVDDWHAAIHVLGDHGALVVETDVVRVRLEDKPGQLAALAERFAREEVNIEYAYGTSDVNGATLYLRVLDVERAEQILEPGK